jgi:SNF2 family DNA or RNA helicase
MEYRPHDYQKTAIKHILDNKSAGLFLSVGLGKTSITLTALEELISTLQVRKVLITAPRRVTSHTWTSELSKWDHLKHLKMERIIGTEKQRLAALNTPADIYVISRDNIVWLIDYCQRILKKFPFDVLVIDELSNYKNRSSQRFRAVRKVLPKLDRIIGLTGTPAPNSLLSLYSQVYLLDKGERLGKTFQIYVDTYFKPGARNGHVVFNYELKKGAEQQISDAISDICISMTAKDYLELPARIDILEEVTNGTQNLNALNG